LKKYFDLFGISPEKWIPMGSANNLLDQILNNYARPCSDLVFDNVIGQLEIDTT